MRRKKLFILGVVVALAVALAAGIAVARAQGGSDLPALTPAELLTKVAEDLPRTTTVSGDVAWTNDLLGTTALPLPGGDAGLASLLQGGSGRFWYQDGKVRLESQGSGGDLVVVLNGDTAWLYNSRSGTATEYTLPAKPLGAGSAGDKTPTTDPAATDPAGAVDLPQKIRDLVDTLAPAATLNVTTDTVAGRDSYVLVMTPTAANTVIGSVQVAFDGETFLPLRVQVFAKEDTQPVLGVGFTGVSYGAIAAGTFDFSPPAGAKVEHTILSLPAGMIDGMMGGVFAPNAGEAAQSERELHGPASLTLSQAEAQVGFSLAVPANPTLPLAAAYVLTPPAASATGRGADSAAGSQPESATGNPPDDAAGSVMSSIAAEAQAPVVVLRYGKGFGSVMMVETTVTDDQWTRLTSSLVQLPVLGTPSAFGGHRVYQVDTRLGSLVAWRQGGLVVLAGGSVPRADLEAFVGGIHE